MAKREEVRDIEERERERERREGERQREREKRGRETEKRERENKEGGILTHGSLPVREYSCSFLILSYSINNTCTFPCFSSATTSLICLLY